MVATLPRQTAPANLERWEPDPDLTAHFGHRTRTLTDDELQTEIARIDHIFWMAVEAGIQHSTAYLVELASERASYCDALAFRARRGYQYREPAPGRFSREALDKLKGFVAIEDEIARSIELRRRGKNYVARCPFHEPDRTPSFTVFPRTQSYYCFGCHAHGDIFSWLMDRQGMTFPAAVRELAARFDVRLDGPDRSSGAREPHTRRDGHALRRAGYQEAIDSVAIIAGLLER